MEKLIIVGLTIYFLSLTQKFRFLKKKCLSVITQQLVYPLKKSRNSPNKKYDILFIGYLEWPPNEVAVRWFIEKILPLIIQKLPKITFHVVGNNNPKLNDLKITKNVIFHGYQKNIDQYLGRSKIFVLPFKTGAGVRIKALTALKNAIPIVSTKLGVDGLKLIKNTNYLSAETDQEFAEQIIKLLNNKNLRNNIGLAGQNYFLKNHSQKNNLLFLKKYLSITDEL